MGLEERDYAREYESGFSLRAPQSMVGTLILINVGVFLLDVVLQGRISDRAELASQRRYALRTPLWGILFASVGWLPGTVIVPGILEMLSDEPLSGWVYVHFAISFVVAGSMALPYSMLAMQFQVLRVVYPRYLAADPSSLRQTTRAELASHKFRHFVLQMMTVLIPLLSAAIIVAAGPEHAATNYHAFRWLVITLISLGVLGSVSAVMVCNRLNQIVTVLTGTERQHLPESR